MRFHCKVVVGSDRNLLDVTLGDQDSGRMVAKANHHLEIKAELYAAAKSSPQAGSGVMAKVGKKILTINNFK